MLVEFEPDKVPGLRFFTIQNELSELFGRQVDLNTPDAVSPYFKEEVLRDVEWLYVKA